MNFSALACHLDAKLTPRYFKNKRSREINRPPRMIAIRAINDDDQMASEASFARIEQLRDAETIYRKRESVFWRR
jgi:hypothetical protein